MPRFLGGQGRCHGLAASLSAAPNAIMFSLHMGQRYGRKCFGEKEISDNNKLGLNVFPHFFNVTDQIAYLDADNWNTVLVWSNHRLISGLVFRPERSSHVKQQVPSPMREGGRHKSVRARYVDSAKAFVIFIFTVHVQSSWKSPMTVERITDVPSHCLHDSQLLWEDLCVSLRQPGAYTDLSGTRHNWVFKGTIFSFLSFISCWAFKILGLE